MRFYWNAKCKIWNRACRIDSWQNQLCIFITRMSIMIFVRVLEKLFQRDHFRSCGENTATPLDDMREIGRFMGFPVPYWKIWLVCSPNSPFVATNGKTDLRKAETANRQLLGRPPQGNRLPARKTEHNSPMCKGAVSDFCKQIHFAGQYAFRIKWSNWSMAICHHAAAKFEADWK